MGERGILRYDRLLRETSPEEVKAVVDRLKREFAKGYVEVGSGRSADVLLLSSFTGDPEAGWVVKQEKHVTPEQRALGITLEDEVRLHDRAHAIIETAIARQAQSDQPKEFAKIPNPISVLQNDDARWFIMEYVSGDTLFERALKGYLRGLNDVPEAELSAEDINAMKRDELIETLSDDTYRFLLPPRLVEDMNNGGTEIDEKHFFFFASGANRQTKGESPVITAQQYQQLSNTLEELHRHGLRHRDLHASNIMIDDTGQVYVLDFGLGLTLSRGEVPESYYTVQIGNALQERMVKLPSDESMLETYEKISRKTK